MKNRIYLFGIIFLVSIFMLSACGGGKYADAKKTMKKQAEISVNYVNALESAESASDVADAINTYTDEMEELIPDIKKMMKDLPEITNHENIPKEVAEESEALAEASTKIQTASQKLVTYIADPEVQKALKHMSEVMQQMNQEG